MTRPLCAALIALAACEGPFVAPPPYAPPPAPPASVTVTPDSATVITDDTLRLSAVVRDSAGNVVPDAVISWVSADTTIAVLTNALGTVRGRRPGWARIRAFAGVLEGEVTVFVTPIVFNAFAAGTNHVCAVANNRHVYCWGKNDEGEIGTGTTSFTEPVPRRNALTVDVISVASGGGHSCALTAGGVAYCWGRFANGQLGRGSTIGDASLPLSVLTSQPFAALTAGTDHTCGLGTDAHASCWGANRSGRVGDGTTTDRFEPRAVIDVPQWLVLSAGANHTCGLATDHLAWCWGVNDAGQLGDSSTAQRHSPTAVLGSRQYSTIAAGGAHTCAVTTAGVLYCWGRNTSGETGSELPDSLVLAPTVVASGLTFRAVATGAQHSCAIASDSTAYCWGANLAGQLGDSSQSGRLTPVPVHGALHFQSLSAGAAYTCGLTGGLVLYCWGDGTLGQLGRPILGSSTIPVKVAGQ